MTSMMDTLDENIYTPEGFAIGVGLQMAGAVGYAMSHPEIPMYLAGEGGDVMQELMSEIGGISTVAEVGGD